MILHRILAEAAVQVVERVLADHQVLDRELAAAFARHPKWGKRDRAFVAETAFEVVRWRRALAFVADADESDTAALCSAQWGRMGIALPDWWRHRGAGLAEMAEREAVLPEQRRAVRESIPDWLDDVGATGLGSDWDLELAALNRRARVYLRVNTLRNRRDEAVAWLLSHGIEAVPVPGLPDALVLPEGRSLPKSLRVEGRVEIQDAGSQQVAPLLGALPGETVIDACAGAGGKTLHLAALMENRGVIHALDVEPRKLRELERRAGAAGATIIRTGPADAAKISALAGRADRLLIDAPCSGLGTLKRQPDLKWRLSPGSLDRIRRIQRELLVSLPRMLRPGGVLVYATCSILPSENREALEQTFGLEAIRGMEEVHISPAATGFDGFYAGTFRPGPSKRESDQ
jgi:16S rRNA (cytosine967-C5)-methyltransferase